MTEIVLGKGEIRRPIWSDTLHYRGFHGCESKCRVDLWVEDDRAAVMFTELKDNPGTSVTNFIEHLASGILDRVCELAGVGPEKIIWLEHYEAVTLSLRGGRRQVIDRPTWDLVQFALCLDGKMTNPMWYHLTGPAAEALIHLLPPAEQVYGGAPEKAKQ